MVTLSAISVEHKFMVGEKVKTRDTWNIAEENRNKVCYILIKHPTARSFVDPEYTVRFHTSKRECRIRESLLKAVYNNNNLILF